MVTAFVVWTLLACFITAGLYWWDKRAARNDSDRIPEATLIMWSALGGWPAAWLTGRLIHHKTRKASYQLKFMFAVAVHVSAVAAGWYLTQGMG